MEIQDLDDVANLLRRERERFRTERDKAVRFVLLLGRAIAEQAELGFHVPEVPEGRIQISFTATQIRVLLAKYQEVLSEAVERELAASVQDPADM